VSIRRQLYLELCTPLDYTKSTFLDSVFRCLKIIATESVKSINGITANHENSGTLGVGEVVEVDGVGGVVEVDGVGEVVEVDGVGGVVEVDGVGEVVEEPLPIGTDENVNRSLIGLAV